MPDHFTHLISDCDGVLIDSEAVALVALLDQLRPYVPSDAPLEALIRPRLGQNFEPMLAEIFREMGLAPLRLDAYEAIREGVEVECDRLLSAVPGVGLALAAIDLPKAVASNSHSVRVHDALARTGLAPLFGGRVFTPDLVGKPKPDPAVYLAAAAGFGALPAHCIVVEDSVTGATAAAAAGMFVLGFTGGGHIGDGQVERLKTAGARLTFDHMEQLPALVSALGR